MKKRLLSLMLVVLMIATCMPTTIMASTTSQIKNIIYMIPDGAGYNTYEFANYVKVAGGFDATKYPYKTPTDTTPMTLKGYLAGSAKTYCADDDTTDSAAAGTALATGHKTNKGYIGVTAQKRPVANVLEAAQSVGKATGIVATYEWVHATPASFSAHGTSRTDYYNLYQQVENKGIDVVLGAGYGEVSKYATIANATARGYKVVATKDEFKAVKPGDKIWGNVASTSLPYDINLKSTQPTLAEMTETAITALSGDEDGFFLMVEGSKVDTGGHAKDAVVTTSEYLAFDAAFKVALDFAKGREDTLIIVTPDHDTGGLKLPEDINTAVSEVRVGTNSALVGWKTSNHTNQNVPVWTYVPQGVSVIPGLNTVLGDTEETRGDFVNRKGTYVIDNIDIAPYIASFMGVDLAELTKDLFVDVTRVGTYDTATETFTFNNGGGTKYVKNNQSHYFKNGQKIEMEIGTMVYINNRVYLPECVIEAGDMEAVGAYDGIAGGGTKADPYIIADEYDFLEFTDGLVAGDTYEGKWFRQTESLDFAGMTEFVGVGKEATFAGIYDGYGNTINISHTVSADKCIFPYVTGVVMNLGTTGSLLGTGSYKGGIARSIRAGGAMVNCYSTMTIAGSSVGGLTYSNVGDIYNCYFAGTLPASSSKALVYDNDGTIRTSYYLDTCGSTQTDTGITSVTSETLTTTLGATLDTGRAQAATEAGVTEDDIGYWKHVGETAPVVYFKIPTVTSVTIIPENAIVHRGDGLQLIANVEGEYDPTDEVKWSIEPPSEFEGTQILPDGYLTVDPNETMESFVVLAKSAIDGSVSGSCEIMLGDEIHTETDGSRSRPFLISSAADFYSFTQSLALGNDFEGKYFKQTANINMVGYPGYNGVGGTSTFAGIYDGNGYSINVNISSDADNCVFPTTSGIIYNLGITGVIKGGTQNGGIAKELTADGVIANCWTNTVLEGKNVGGIVFNNYGKIANCYVGGSVEGTGTTHKTMSSTGKGAKNNYCKTSSYSVSQTYTKMTASEMKNKLLQWLTDGIETAADVTGIASYRFSPWAAVSGRGPRHTNSAGFANTYSQTVITDATYGSGKITASVLIPSNGKANVAYMILYTADGNSILGVQRKTFTNGLESTTFDVTCGTLASGNYELKLMMWDGSMGAYMIPETTTITVE